MIKVQIQRLSEDAKIPLRGSEGAAGYDFYCTENTTVLPHTRSLLKTDIALGIPTGYYLRLESRSGLSAKMGIEKGAGIIDEDYTKAVGVILYNHSNDPVHFIKGDRVCQGIFQKYEVVEFEEVDQIQPKDYSTRTDGFGHTGMQ